MDTEIFIDPSTGSSLTSDKEFYYNNKSDRFPKLKNGIPNFTYPQVLMESDQTSLDWYKLNASDYDEYLPLTFKTFDVDEGKERQKMIDALDIRPGNTVLELGAGTGRDTTKILEALNGQGSCFIQDISPEIMEICHEKLNASHQGINKIFFLSNAAYLPLKDNSFDRIFHFGGLNTFSERKRAIKEIVRVAKPDAKVVIGDENMPVWLRNTEFGEVLMNSNPHYAFDLPLEDLPKEARNVKVEWFIGGVFYFIQFEVGLGDPYANIDFEIPGLRGGSHRTRYYGQLEGVNSDQKKKIYEYAKLKGLSVSSVLEELISKLDN